MERRLQGKILLTALGAGERQAGRSMTGYLAGCAGACCTLRKVSIWRFWIVPTVIDPWLDWLILRYDVAVGFAVFSKYRIGLGLCRPLCSCC